tara:strand:+ start:260 stop:640 length:381 start_codon:yes stop_codon:yes gene_type:complete
MYGVIKMFAVLGKILGSGDVLKQGLQLIDDMHTSTEEEIAAKTQQRVQMMQSYQPFKLAQRYIALMFTFTFLLCFVITLGMTLAGKGDTDGIKDLVNQWWIGEIMLIIVGFYFGAGLTETIKQKNK